MKWIKRALKEGNWREHSAFLFLPLAATNKDGDRETRWLERAKWKEKYIGRGESGTDYWAHQEWMNTKTEK